MSRKGAVLRGAIVSIILVVSALGSVHVGLRLVQEVERHLLSLRAHFVGELEAAVAQELSWESVNPSVLRGLTIHGVSVSDGTGTAQSVSVSFRLGELLRGDPYRMIPLVTIRRPTVILDTPESLERLTRTIDFFWGVGEGRRIISVEVENGTLQLQIDDHEVGLYDANGTVHVESSRIHAQMRTSLDLATSVQEQPFTLSTDLALTVDSHRSGDPAGVTAELFRISGSHLTAADQTVRIERHGSTIAVERVRSQDALDLAARIDLEAQEILVTARSQSLVPLSLVEFRGPWTAINEWITNPVTTNSSAIVSLDGSFVEAWGSAAGRIDHSVIPEPVSIQGDFRLSPDRVAFPTLHVRAGQGSAVFSGSWRPGTISPDGTVSFRQFAYAGSPILDGSVILSGSESELAAATREIRVNGLSLYHVDADFRPRALAGSRYNSLKASFSLEENLPSMVQATVRFVDPDDFTGRLDFLELSVAEVASAAAAFGYDLEIPAPARGIRVNGTARFDHRDGDTLIRAPYITARDETNQHRFAALSGEYRNGQIILSHYYARDESVHIAGGGSVTLYRDGTIDFASGFAVNQVEYFLEGRLTAQGELMLSGPYGFDAHITRTTGGGFAVHASARDVPLPLAGVRFSFDLDGIFFDPMNWYLNMQEVHVRNIPVPGPDGELRRGRVVFAAAVQPETVQVAITALDDGTSVLAGALDVRYYLADEGIDLSVTGNLGGLEEPELYRFAARYSEGSAALDVRFSDAPATRFTSQVERGTISGTIQAVGTLDQPEIRAFLESDRLIHNGSAASFRFLFQSDETVVRIAQGELRYGTVRLDVPQMILDRITGSLEGSVDFRRLDQDVSLEISGWTDPVPVLSPDILQTTNVDLSLRVAPGQEHTAPVDPRAWHYELVRTADMTTLNRMDGAIQAELSDQGDFSVMVGGDLPYRGRATGIFTSERMEMTVSNIFVDLARIPLPVSMEQFAIPAGVVSGSLRVIGPPGDPDFFGTLTVRDLELETPFSPDRAGPIETALIFEEKLIRLQQARGRIGRAPVDVSAQILVNRFALEEFELLMDLPGETGAYVVSEFGPVTVDGFARGNLRLGGTPENLNVTGTINIYGTEIAVAQDFEPDLAGGPNTTVDLQIRTGRAVRFIWPDTELPIIRSNFATGQEVRLQVDTRDDTFSLDGTVAIQSGDVFYFDRNFLLRTGRIEFRETQDDFDPRITARAELREATPDGPVRIYLVADGQRLSEFSPRFDSSPPLDSVEIVAILGGSILQVGSEGSVTLPTALLSTSDVVTQFGFFRQFENAVRDQLDLDLFAIRTSIVQNILLTALTPADDQVQQQATPSLGTYLNNTSIFMGRYIGDSVFGQLVVQMRASDPIFQPEDDGIQRLGGVLIDSEISLEWQTPFFLLEWNFAPQNPEELFIRDNTFSFLWSFSY